MKTASKKKDLINNYDLSKHVYLHSFLLYVKFLSVIRRSSFLILLLGDSPAVRVLFPTKFFDYLGVKRPIFYIGGDGQVSETIEECDAGICCKPDPIAISDSLIKITKELNVWNWYMKEENYRKLDRSNIFSDFCNSLNNLS